MGGRFSRVEVVANVASGSVGPGAPAELARILDEFGIRARICAPPAKDLQDCLKAAVAAEPELLIVLAGDGTARSAAELCGPRGPILMALPGGTMNILPHALYGARRWPDALRAALDHGEVSALSGGEVEGHSFLVAAIIGAPALWAPAREAMRHRRGQLALIRARRALRRAFTGRLRYIFDGGQREKAEALMFMTPLASRAMDSQTMALEAAAFDVTTAAQAFRLGLLALVGDWRRDPLVQSEPCRVARVWSARGIPALLDGELVKLKALSEVRFAPLVARVLALPQDRLA